MYTPPPPEGPKKTPVWVWILAAAGGVIVLGIIAIGLLSYYAFQKVKEVATNPAAAAALIAKIDPNLEVLDVDENKKIIRVRNRQNNEEVTLNMADIMQGKLKLSHDGKDGVESVEIGGQVKLPNWMPKYPGSDPKGIGAASSDKDGSGGMFSFETSDSPDKILAFYKEALEKRGFKNEEGGHAGGTAVLVMKSEGEGGATVTVTPQGSASQVTVLYGSK
jgi:hypothetical protein